MSRSVQIVRSGPLVQAVALLIVVVVLGAAFANSAYWLGLITTATILYILAASLNLLFGYAGLFALGQQGLYAAGAYLSVIVGVHVSSLPWIVDVIAAVVGSGVIGFLLALPTSRLRGEYLALATIAFGVGVQALLIAWIGVTGGPDGLANVPEASLFGSAIVPGTQAFLWVVGVGAALALLVSGWMVGSRLGRSLSALRDNPLASQSVGINPTVTRSIAFGVSGAMAGLAGALFAAQQLFISPDQFDFTLLIGVLVAVLIGGAGRSLGPIVGAIALTTLQRLTNGLGSLEGVVYAGLLVVIIMGLPNGVIGLGERLIARWRPRPARRSAVGPGAADVAADSPEFRRFARPRVSAPVAGAAPRILELRDVSCQFGGVRAVSNVSLTVRRGEVVGLIGPNGAGKTTLVNIATGVLSPSGGDVLLGDRRLQGLAAHQVSRAGITRTFQHPQLSSRLTVLENAMLGLDRMATATLAEAMLHLPRSRADERRFRGQAMALLHRVGIACHADAVAGSVPYGVQRRLEVARALACAPDFIFLDEAGAGLDDSERAELIAAMRQIAGSESGPGVVVIEHNIAFVRELCPRTTVLVGGSVLASGETGRVLDDERVIDAYLGRPAGDGGEVVGVDG